MRRVFCANTDMHNTVRQMATNNLFIPLQKYKEFLISPKILLYIFYTTIGTDTLIAKMLTAVAADVASTVVTVITPEGKNYIG